MKSTSYSTSDFVLSGVYLSVHNTDKFIMSCLINNLNNLILYQIFTPCSSFYQNYKYFIR